MNKRKRIVLYLVLIAGSLFSCKGPTGIIPEPSLLVLECPENITPEFKDGNILITWSTVENAAEYYIYRKDGNSDFSLINSSPLTTFLDSDYPKDAAIQYAVKSVDGTVQSELSSPSVRLTEWITNVEVSVLEFTDRIRITWDKQTEADKYIIYRSSSRNGDLLELARISVSENILEFEDKSDAANNAPKADTPYFYQIQWIKDDVLYGVTCPGTLGGFSSTVDIAEPLNNDFQTMVAGNFIQDNSNPPVLYSFGDGKGEIDADIDWYQYVGHGGDEVDIEIAKPSEFKKIELQYYYNGEYSTPIIIDSNPYNFIYNIPGSPEEEAILYFSIIPVSTTTDNIFGTYSIVISSNSFDPTIPIEPVDPADPADYVKNLEASLLEYNNRIKLSWDRAIDVEEYIIYRASSRDVAPIEIDRVTDSRAYIEYNDSTALADIPYYYQVRWINQSIEYGSASSQVLGVRSNTVDINEPLNNEYSTLNSGSYVPDNSNPPILYSFNDGKGLIESDTDWYRYEGKKGDSVSFEILKPTVFNTVELQIYYNGNLEDPIQISKDTHQEIFTIPDPFSTQEDTTVYFKIYPVTGSNENIIGTYSVTISNSL